MEVPQRVNAQHDRKCFEPFKSTVEFNGRHLERSPAKLFFAINESRRVRVWDQTEDRSASNFVSSMNV